MMFLVVVFMMFVVTTNSVKYGLHTNITPQEGYKDTKIDACGLAIRKLGKNWVLLVFLCFIQNRQSWQPPGQYGVGTRPMAASSGFA
jgi:hypothetical protein